MKSLTGSTSNLSLVKCNGKYYINCLNRPEIHFLGCVKHNHVGVGGGGSGFSLCVSSQRHLIHPIFSTPALSSSDTQTHLQDEELKAPDEKAFPGENQSKTVHVKFQLQKECLFGQHFFVVGDDPMFGSWEPLDAVPLNWSDGHVWTLELDIPIEKMIKYKFILKGGEDTVLWQPGEDRVLQTWETAKTITIIEDWDNSEIRNIIEEEPISEASKDYSVNPELLMVAENLGQPIENLEDDVNKDHGYVSNYSISAEKSSLENLLPKANTADETGKLEIPGSKIGPYTKKSNAAGVKNASESNQRANNGKDLLAPGKNMNLVRDEEFPVLVPGLPPMPRLQTEKLSVPSVEENAVADLLAASGLTKTSGLTPMSTLLSEESSEENEVADISLEFDKAEESNVPEFKNEAAAEASGRQQTTDLVLNGQQQLHEDQHAEKMREVEGHDGLFSQPPGNKVLESDIQWGQRTLRKLLMNFGLL